MQLRLKMAGSQKKETMKCVSHEQACKLLHNKFIVVLGDSIQRSVYKDLVLLLQRDKYLTVQQLKSKGQMSFEQDCLIEGGRLGQMHNGTQYREVRQFKSAHHLVRFYFVTRIYSSYMKSLLDDFRHGLKPDVVIVNSCVWDVSRYNSSWISTYKDNLISFFDQLSEILPEETLVMWSLTMPLAEKIRGGFLVPEFRSSMHHRMKDGVHWNAVAHRKITSLLLQHAAQAWGVCMPCPVTTVENTEVTVKQPVWKNPSDHAERNPLMRNYNCNDSIRFSHFLNFEDNHRQRQWHDTAGTFRSAWPPQPYFPVHSHKNNHGHNGNGFNYRPYHHHPEPNNDHHHQYVMRSRHRRRHAPYSHHRPHQYAHYDGYY
ncbi:PC-esterase domain-containing protein 1A isoform X2 [Solea solea]|uniref:PC-esterase domain-containing protein 1A isoform X2 n=1 Tax=Solea solea TaxID=90069 RepID=UPI00272C1A2C|nr:PC-esterase domain-containing protein 1A isoform X2 [Solea solea]